MAADALFDQAASVLIDRGIDGGIDCAIVLGTGLGRIIDDMVDPVSIPFEEIIDNSFAEQAVKELGG